MLLEKENKIKPFIDLYKSKYCILDTETTGLDETAEIVEISIIDRDCNVLLDTLIKPVNPIHPEAAAVNHISDEMVKSCKPYTEYYEEIKGIFMEYETVIIYNKKYDKRILEQTAKLHNLKPIIFSSDCLMELYTEYWGEWSRKHKAYKNQSLINACKQQKVDISDLDSHRALSDCIATNRLLVALANRK